MASFNLTAHFRQAAARGDTTVPIGVRIGPGPYGHGALRGHWSGPNFAKAYNASALPLLFEVHIVTKTGAGETGRHILASGAGDADGGSAHNEVATQTMSTLRFSAHSDPILNSDWYLGETVDNTLSPEVDGWDTTGYSEAGKHWQPAVAYTALAGRQLAPASLGPIVRLVSTRWRPATLRPTVAADSRGALTRTLPALPS